jgi:hypothetical protein
VVKPLAKLLLLIAQLLPLTLLPLLLLLTLPRKQTAPLLPLTLPRSNQPLVQIVISAAPARSSLFESYLYGKQSLGRSDSSEWLLFLPAA